MGNLGGFWSLNDWVNAREAWIGPQGYTDRAIIFRKFLGYQEEGNEANPDEKFRVVKYLTRSDSIWISQVKVYDTIKGGYFTTGDLSCSSLFTIRGYSPAYTLPSGVVIPEYAGDQVIWNGKVWVVADQVEPVQAGYQAPFIWHDTVLRRTDRSGIGTAVGP